MNIAISIGHHRDAQGAEYKGITEYALATGWAYELAESLAGSYIVSGILSSKVRKINNADTDLAVEIHFNSYKVWEDANADGLVTDDELKHAGSGSETLYYPGSIKGKLFAQCVQDNLGRVAAPNRGVKEGWYRMNPDKGADFFLAKTICPSIIIEPEFIHRLDEINAMRSSAIAAISEGVLLAYEEIYNVTS